MEDIKWSCKTIQGVEGEREGYNEFSAIIKGKKLVCQLPIIFENVGEALSDVVQRQLKNIEGE